MTTIDERTVPVLVAKNLTYSSMIKGYTCDTEGIIRNPNGVSIRSSYKGFKVPSIQLTFISSGKNRVIEVPTAYTVLVSFNPEYTKFSYRTLKDSLKYKDGDETNCAINNLYIDPTSSYYIYKEGDDTHVPTPSVPVVEEPVKQKVIQLDKAMQICELAKSADNTLEFISDVTGVDKQTVAEIIDGKLYTIVSNKYQFPINRKKDKLTGDVDDPAPLNKKKGLTDYNLHPITSNTWANIDNIDAVFERLYKLFESKNLSELERRINTTHCILRNWFKKGQFPEKLVTHLYQTFKLNPYYITLGNGEPYLRPNGISSNEISVNIPEPINEETTSEVTTPGANAKTPEQEQVTIASEEMLRKEDPVSSMTQEEEYSSILNALASSPTTHGKADTIFDMAIRGERIRAAIINSAAAMTNVQNKTVSGCGGNCTCNKDKSNEVQELKKMLTLLQETSISKQLIKQLLINTININEIKLVFNYHNGSSAIQYQHYVEQLKITNPSIYHIIKFTILSFSKEEIREIAAGIMEKWLTDPTTVPSNFR